MKLHAAIEEDIFYPTVRKHVGKDLMNEADEEQHVARLLIAELDANAAPDHRHAKFTVLAESVRHHIREEESEMLPKAKELASTSRRLAGKCSPASKISRTMASRATPNMRWSPGRMAKATHQRPRRAESRPWLTGQPRRR